MTDTSPPNRWLCAWTVLLAAALFLLDTEAPVWIDFGVVYLALLPLSLWSARQSFIRFVAIVATCLLLLGLFLAPPHAVSFATAASARMLVIAVIWVTVILYMRRQEQASAEEVIRRKTEQVCRESEELLRAKLALEQTSQELIATRDVAVYTLAKVAESRDMETGQHLERIRAYCHILALELRKDPVFAKVIDERFLADLYASSPLHDIGKVGIRDDILLKPGPLEPEEFEAMKRHTVIGYNMLQDAISHMNGAEFLEMGALIARCHHEWFDGSGYPAGLSGPAIPLAARIVALADVFDALTSERPYKNAFSPQVAREMIERESGSHFDPVIVEAFKRRFDDVISVQLRYPNKHVQIFGITESLLAEICE